MGFPPQLQLIPATYLQWFPTIEGYAGSQPVFISAAAGCERCESCSWSAQVLWTTPASSPQPEALDLVLNFLGFLVVDLHLWASPYLSSY